MAWGYLATAFKRRWLTILAIVMMVFIPLSRIYLGVHYPTDVLGGYVIGGLFLLGGIWFLEPIGAWLGKKGLWWQIGLTVLVTVLLLGFLPTHDDNGITEAALLCSGGIGLALESRYVRFSSRGTPTGLIMRLLLGLVVLFGLRFFHKRCVQSAWLGNDLPFYPLHDHWPVVRDRRAVGFHQAQTG